MPYKNPKDLLTDATKFPAAIEAKLPEGAPKVSTMLADATGRIPEIPDFPMEIPDLPAPPELPEAPTGLKGLGRQYVTGVEVTPVRREVIPSPAVGVIPEVIVRRGM
jgi:hypothetical protein